MLDMGLEGLGLRQAVPEDREFALRAREAAFRPTVEAAGGWNETEQRALHERRFAEQDFRVIEIDGSAAGILAMVVAEDEVKVNQLMILPEHQGKGIGRECMRLVEEDARRRRLPVRLRVLKVNPRALAFYERLGYVRTDETATHVRLELTSP